MVPVIRDVDKKISTSRELADVSRARESKLKPDDLQGGCIGISSLGGIGGTAFTPIVNAPDWIRGRPIKDAARLNGSEFEPRLMLPLDLSYDHRVIDGAAAARFVAYLTVMLSDVETASLGTTMAEVIEVRCQTSVILPVEIIEIHVASGDSVEEDSLVTLESTSNHVPSPVQGVRTSK